MFPVDDEYKYVDTLAVTPRWHGHLTLHVTCPPRPQAHVAEDAPLGTAVLTVRAVDDDLGVNGQITYSLNNETQWRFRIDNDSGKITTAG